MSTPAFDFAYSGNLSWLKARTIYLTRHGSHAYGTNTPTSDMDCKGFAIPPREYFLGFLQRFEQAEVQGSDFVIYDLRKFVYLAAECNPSIIEVLWTDPSDHLIVAPLAERVLAERAAFLSQKARHTFAGYAASQLKRIRTHHRWIMHPPSEPPSRAEFGLPERAVIPKDQLSAAQALITKKLDEWNIDFENVAEGERVAALDRFSSILAEMQLHAEGRYQAAGRAVGYDANFLELLDKERAYRSKQNEWEQFQHWKKTRNPTRAALEEKFGFDTKHAMHLVRLMRMCREILETGRVVVRRPDAEELLSIRYGAWTYEQLEAWAASEDKGLDEVMKRSPLPRAPNRAKLDELCVSLVEEALRHENLR
jgi:hypothetical protein